MSHRPRYVPNVGKALEAVLWFGDQRPGIDVYHVVKGAFFADKFHIANFGRPLVGDEYRAAPFGPLPQVMYAIMRKQPIEMLALGNNGPLPFSMDQSHRLHVDRGPNLRKLSSSDIRALEHGLREVDGKSFDDLFAITHDDPAYLNAVAGIMDYRDFIPEGAEDRAEKIGYIEEVASVAVF